MNAPAASSERLARANRIAQVVLAVLIAVCIAYGAYKERHGASVSRNTSDAAHVASGLPGPFEHGLIPGRTRLIQAILSKKTPLALSLLRTGDPAQVNASDSLGWTPLIAAAYRGDAKIAAALLDLDASTSDANQKGKTALIYAAQAGSSAVAAMLLAHGAQSNRSDASGATPLMWAAMRGNAKLCALLIAAGADVNHLDRRGYTALSVAALGQSSAIVKLLLAAAANPAIGAGQDDELPLDTALDSGDAVDARALILAGAPVNARTPDGFTPLMLAAQNNLPQSTIDLLLARGADAQASLSDGTTALCYACAAPSGNAAIVSALLQHGASPTAGPTDRTTPLMYAAEAGHGDIVQLLLAHGARARTVTNRGMTALHWAVGEGSPPQIGLLLRRSGETE